MKYPSPPTAPKISKDIQAHGISWSDPWFWLRNKDDPAVLEYLQAENAYTDAVMDSTASLQQDIYNEMRARIREDDATVPEKEGPYFYYERYEKGSQYPIYCRKYSSLDSPEQIILDVNQLAKGKPYLQLGVCDNSPDHRYIAYSVDLDGSEEYTIHIKDLANGHLLEECITRTYDSLEWTNDCETFFYTKLDQHQRPREVYRHRLGTSPKQDELVYEEVDPRFFLTLVTSESRRFIYLGSEGNNMSEWRYLEANESDNDFTLIEPRSENHEYDVTDHGDRFFINTNIKDAKDFKIVEVPIAEPRSDNWKDFIGHQRGTLITDFTVFTDYIVVEQTIQALPQIKIINLTSDASHDIAFDDEAYEAAVIVGREFETNMLRFSYTTLTTPECIYDYDMSTGKRHLRKQEEVLGDFHSANYCSKRIYAESDDGTNIPISLFYRQDTPLDGTAPLLLYGYGSYGHSMSADFSHTRLSYVDRGFVYAIAHIRGGMEMGYEWYENGKLLKKKNTFNDYIACAEHLAHTKFTTRGKIIAASGSAGGMLMGVIANERPSLWGAIIAHVPFVDVINTMLDDELPLTTMEYNEWGNPHDKAHFEYIRSYSPYDNVKAQVYPPMLVVAGLNDPRVTYWEPAKWVARLRDLKTDNNLLLLKVHMGFGHSGASGRFEYLKEKAFDISFALKALGRA